MGIRTHETDLHHRLEDNLIRHRGDRLMGCWCYVGTLLIGVGVRVGAVVVLVAYRYMCWCWRWCWWWYLMLSCGGVITVGDGYFNGDVNDAALVLGVWSCGML